MASLKKIPVWDIQLGMIIVKCDKSGVPFGEYGRPLSNLGYIHDLYDHGVEHVYIWVNNSDPAPAKKEEPAATEEEVAPTTAPILDAQKEADEEFIVKSEDDLNTTLLTTTVQLVSMLKENFSQSLEGLKMGKSIDAPSAINIVTDIINMSGENPEIFSKIMLEEGLTQDDCTHGINVCINAVTLGQAIGMQGKELLYLGLASLFHDIGKVRIPEQILHKKGNLNDYEVATIKRHPEYAGQILQRYEDIPEDVINIIHQHHENCDGTGYPSGINAQYISRSAKVLAIAEAYNTMLSDTNEYPRALNNTDAIKKIYAEAGKKYQSAIVKTFITIMGVYPVGTAVLLSNGSIGIVAEINQLDQSRPKVLAINKNNPKKIELLNLKTSREIKIVKEINNSDLNINTFEIFNSFLTSRMNKLLASH